MLVVAQTLIYSLAGILFVWAICLIARSHLIMKKAQKEDMEFHFRNEDATKKSGPTHPRGTRPKPRNPCIMGEPGSKRRPSE